MKKRKTSSFLNDPVGVGAILDEKLSEGHYEKPHNFIVAIHACDNQRSLFVTAGLLINIDVFVSQ
jgi:hypothetical protein